MRKHRPLPATASKCLWRCLPPTVRAEAEPMNCVARTILIAATLALPLAGCGGGPDINFDPLEWLAGDPFGTKKPLPGERKALFPEGVPGVARGVPPEVVKGNQSLAGAEDAPQDAALQ